MPAADGTVVPVECSSWSSGMAPAYIGTFLWVAFFDGLGKRALPVGGLGPSLLGVLAASILGYLLLYRVPALWGFATGRSLNGVSASTFGERGALVIPNLLIALGQVGLFAVGIGYGTEWMLDGLLTLGLVEPPSIRAVRWGGAVVPSPLFLTSAMVWGLVVALAGMGIVRWIAAIMQYFPVFPAVGLALAMAGGLTGLRSFRPGGIDPTTGTLLASAEGARLAFLTTFQWTFGFLGLLGITGADWGAASLTQGDVRKGGWFGIAFAPVVVASLALLAIVGNEGKVQDRVEASSEIVRGGVGAASTKLDPTVAQGRYTFRSAVVEAGFDRRLTATTLIIFALASFAPACYAAYEFGRRLSSVAPGFSKLAWTLVGVASGWFLIVGGWFARTELVFSILGGLFAPVAGAIVADSARQFRAGWPAPRPGTNFAGVIAWTLGAAVGLAPIIARAIGSEALAKVAPASLLAFVAAFIAYLVAAAIGLESRNKSLVTD